MGLRIFHDRRLSIGASGITSTSVPTTLNESAAGFSTTKVTGAPGFDCEPFVPHSVIVPGPGTVWGAAGSLVACASTWSTPHPFGSEPAGCAMDPSVVLAPALP